MFRWTAKAMIMVTTPGVASRSVGVQGEPKATAPKNVSTIHPSTSKERLDDPPEHVEGPTASVDRPDGVREDDVLGRVVAPHRMRFECAALPPRRL